MRYQYNYAFLAQWAEANPKLAKGHLQNALGVKSNNGIKAWMRMEGPMPIVSMLRFCNTFGVPLSAFFRDEDADTYTTTIPLPQVNDQLEPDGGFADDPNDRQRGERSILDPTKVSVIPSIVPGVELSNAHVEQCPAIEDSHKEEPIFPPTPSNMSDATFKAVIDLETKHSTQREHFLNIIAEQQKQIAELTKQIIAIQHDMPKYHVVKEYDMENYEFPSIKAAESNT